MGTVLLLSALILGYTVWRIVTGPTHAQARRIEAAIEIEPSRKPLPPLLRTYEAELEQP